LLHTSDWHLGRSLHGVDLTEGLAAYLDHLVDLARQVRPAATLVAGDVYDRAVPPVGAVQLLEESLTRLAELTQVIVISGNHDSATRLGFAAGLMRPEIKLVTRLDQIGRAVEVADPDGGPGALIYPAPFLDAYAAADYFSDQDNPVARSHEAVTAAALGRVRLDLARRGLGGVAGGDPAASDKAADAANRQSRAANGRPATVVMGHAFVVGGAASESERDLTVGGVATVPVGVFAGIDYVALGHLHGPQRIAAPEPQLIRYSGSPLAFSFSETGQTKSTAVVTLGGASPAAELVPAPVPRPLSQVEGMIADLESRRFDDLADHWLRVTVTDPSRPEDLVQRLRRRFPHALVIRHLPSGPALGGPGRPVTAASDPSRVVAEFIEFAGGAPPTEAELGEVGRALEAARRGGEGR
jgi:exonuclease SbcD